MTKKPIKENVNKLISLIKENQNLFYMATLHDYTHCGTTHCLAGWAAVIIASERDNYKDYTDIEFSDIYEWFGFDREYWREGEGVLGELFHLGNGSNWSRYAANFDSLPNEVRNNIAIDVLKHFRDTGAVDWRRFITQHGFGEAVYG